MHPCKYCRTCLSEDNLHPIFAIPEHSAKYTEIILNTTGMKVELNDNLPQEMCSPCISFINESFKFRRKCAIVEKALLDNKFDVKLDDMIKQEGDQVCIDISELFDDDFLDYEDNITLDILQSNGHTQQDSIETQGEKECSRILEKEKPDNEIYKCKKSKKSTRKNTSKPKVDSEEDNKRNRVREEIQCEYCNKILTSKLSLRNHNKIHTGYDIVCEHCGKRFITQRLLLMHCRAKHGYEKTDKCSYCDYKASNAEQVKIHERTHTGEKPYKCPHCGAGFHRRSSYLQHVPIHLSEKTVLCEKCPARFKSVTLMRIHMSSRHKPPRHVFRCGVCGGNFSRRRNVMRHLVRVHAMAADAKHVLRLEVT